MPSSEYQSEFEKYTSQGYRLLLVNGYTVNNQDKYVAIWEKSPGPAWAAKHGMTSADYQVEFGWRSHRGYRLKLVSGYTVSGEDRYADIWEKDPLYQSKLRQPIDTWENIHTFLTFDFRISEQYFPLLSRYDFIWGAGTFVHTHQPPIKPEMLVTFYITGGRDLNPPLVLNNVDHNRAWYRHNHPDWGCLPMRPKDPAYEADQTTYIPIDISNPDVIAFQANVYGQWSADHGEDALGADNISLQNITAAPGYRCGIYKNGKWVQLYSGTKQDPKFAADVVNWAHRLRLRLHKLSPPQSLIVNLSCIDSLHPQQPFLQQFMQEVDGVLEEGGFFACSSYPLSDNDRVHKIEPIRDIQGLGLPYYGINEYGPAPTPATNYDCSEAVEIPADFIGWSIASYLMSKEHSTALYMSRSAEYGCALWYPEYEAKVGHPCGEMYKSQNVYMRKHSKALSIVNTNPNETYQVDLHQVDLPAARQYVDLHGNVVSSPIPAPPNSGHVLLITAGPNFCQ